MKKWFQLFLLIIPCCTISTVSFAHARWTLDGPTPPRSDRTDIKFGPCGGIARTDTPAIFTPGETITVEFFQDIYHSGYYRIAFSPANDENFDANVLVDNIPDFAGQVNYSQEITLPAIECDDCTLQLIQVMLDRNPPTNYFSCADIQLTNNPQQPPEEPGDVEDDFVPPANVIGSPPEMDDTSALLKWTNPQADFAGVVVLQYSSGLVGIPQSGLSYRIGDSIGDAQVIYAGEFGSILVANLDSGTSYVFKVFAFDQNLNYSSGTAIIATTTGESAVVPDVDEDQNADDELVDGNDEEIPDNTDNDTDNSPDPVDGGEIDPNLEEADTTDSGGSSSGSWSGIDLVLLLYLFVLIRVRRRIE